MTYNNTFRGAAPTWANACVGNNGSADFWTYAKGFSQAANLLIQAVLSDRGTHFHVDEFVYPVCFNMRHSVELRLKGAIAHIQDIARIRGKQLDFNFSGSHDLKLMWLFFVEQSLRLDERYRPIEEKIAPLIRDLGDVDPTGQTFRYPLSTESRRHLSDVPLINFVILYQTFGELESQLDSLHGLGEYLRREYGLGTFTNNLSRHQLWRLAHSLPPRKEWSNRSFKQVCDALKNHLGVSSRELSRAINLIKCNYEFAALIGESAPLLGLSAQQIKQFLGYCVRRNEDSTHVSESADTEVSLTLDDSLSGYEKFYGFATKAWDEFKDTINPEALAGLKALYYFEWEPRFSEEYVSSYYHQLESSRSAFGESAEKVKESFIHLLSKVDIVQNILRTLYFLRKTDFADELVQSYGLGEKFSWLADARNGRLFTQPAYSGYSSTEAIDLMKEITNRPAENQD